MDIEFEPPSRVRRAARFKARLKYQPARYASPDGRNLGSQDFTCAHCRQFVSAHYLLSGVKNRNHCPYCLWSRHLDLFAPGDRMAACKAPMRPVGLTLKRTRKKYGRDKNGELMLVHLCTECPGLSINRIAADDDASAILEMFAETLHADFRDDIQLERMGIRVLGAGDLAVLQEQLLGRSP